MLFSKKYELRSKRTPGKPGKGTDMQQLTLTFGLTMTQSVVVEAVWTTLDDSQQADAVTTLSRVIAKTVAAEQTGPELNGGRGCDE